MSLIATSISVPGCKSVLQCKANPAGFSLYYTFSIRLFFVILGILPRHRADVAERLTFPLGGRISKTTKALGQTSEIPQDIDPASRTLALPRTKEDILVAPYHGGNLPGRRRSWPSAKSRLVAIHERDRDWPGQHRTMSVEFPGEVLFLLRARRCGFFWPANATVRIL